MKYRILLNDIYKILLGDNKMISYSPNSRYTAQKIADKVSNGAYFYSHFSVESDNTLFFDNIQNLLKKLTDKYSLNLTARQRTYRLNTKKEPIADLIIQKRSSIEGVNIFDFWLLITTPKSHDYNQSKSEIALKKIPNQRISEAVLDWNRALEQEEIQFIQNYYQDHEKFKFVLHKPYLKIVVDKGHIELVRLSHSSKKSKKYAPTEKSAKNYTWTWRYDEPTLQVFKKKYIEIMNVLISNPDKTVGMSMLETFYKRLRFYTVFKGNRHQMGRLLTEAVSYHYKKTRKDFRKVDYYVPLELDYLPRLTNYADDFLQYTVLRKLREDANLNLSKDKVTGDAMDQLIQQHLL